MGVLTPGQHTLDARELPFLGMFVDWATAGNAFKAEIYFVGTREFPNNRFGGRLDEVQDPVSGLIVTLRTFGGIVYVALAASVLGYICWNKGVEALGANRAGFTIPAARRVLVCQFELPTPQFVGRLAVMRRAVGAAADLNLLVDTRAAGNLLSAVKNEVLIAPAHASRIGNAYCDFSG